MKRLIIVLIVVTTGVWTVALLYNPQTNTLTAKDFTKQTNSGALRLEPSK